VTAVSNCIEPPPAKVAQCHRGGALQAQKETSLLPSAPQGDAKPCDCRWHNAEPQLPSHRCD